MNKINRPVIPIDLIDEPIRYNWKLVREHDGLIKYSSDIIWIEWDENGIFKSKHIEPALNRSLLMSPFNQSFTWQTTPVTELKEVTDQFISFSTENSVYKLYKINNDR